MYGATNETRQLALASRRRVDIGDVVYLRQWNGLVPVVMRGTVTAVNRSWASVTMNEGQVVKVRRHAGLSSDGKEAFDSPEDAMVGLLVRLLWRPAAPWCHDRHKLLTRAERVANALRVLQSSSRVGAA